MIRIRTLTSLLLALGAATLMGCASSSSAPSKTEWDGLVLQPDTRLGAVFIRPGAVISSYTSVLLDPVQISFASDWDPNRNVRNPSNRLSAADIASLKSGLSDLFRETFRAELARSGYVLVDAEGPETLRVTPAIINLYVTAPAASSGGRSRVYTATSGRMTLVAELRDSVTNELLARAVDARAARSAGAQLTWSSSVTNRADARRAIGVWASALVRGLDGVYGKPVAPVAEEPAPAAP